MKLILRTLLLGVILYFLPADLPWWSIVVVGILMGIILPGPALNTFISGFLAGGLMWLFLSWQIDNATGSYLSEKIIELFPFSDATYLIILSGLIGGLLVGLATLSGSSFRQIFSKKKKKTGFYQ